MDLLGQRGARSDRVFADHAQRTVRLEDECADECHVAETSAADSLHHLVARTTGRVVMVGHSYGGAVISEAALSD
ncbi:alpha/beta fold hydrolase [Microbacterium sp. AK031]|uniref:alpha/beta fold hydrolase n=1 Tax=Microbacterium sp. AK031 TaxID=2723076 RepID=UPI0037C55F2B|nr:pimeloyl-ACP methyl ester carboxylesterase [Microbacterium sp. AK031]